MCFSGTAATVMPYRLTPAPWSPAQPRPACPMDLPRQFAAHVRRLHMLYKQAQKATCLNPGCRDLNVEKRCAEQQLAVAFDRKHWSVRSDIDACSHMT